MKKTILSLSTVFFISGMPLFGAGLDRSTTQARLEAELNHVDTLIARLPITGRTSEYDSYLKIFFESKPSDQWMAYMEAVDVVLGEEGTKAQTYYELLLLAGYFETPANAKREFIATFPMMTMRTKYMPYDLALAMRLVFVDGRVMSQSAYKKLSKMQQLVQ